MRKRFQERRYGQFTFLTLFAERRLFHLGHNHARFRRERFYARAKRYRYSLNHRE